MRIQYYGPVNAYIFKPDRKNICFFIKLIRKSTIHIYLIFTVKLVFGLKLIFIYHFNQQTFKGIITETNIHIISILIKLLSDEPLDS